MTGTYTQNPLVSRITLALMEDTGWYSADYSQAQPLIWGKGLGCDFVLNSCRQWIETKQLQYKDIGYYLSYIMIYIFSDTFLIVS